jgi:hypothetical protein
VCATPRVFYVRNKQRSAPPKKTRACLPQARVVPAALLPVDATHVAAVPSTPAAISASNSRSLTDRTCMASCCSGLCPPPEKGPAAPLCAPTRAGGAQPPDRIAREPRVRHADCLYFRHLPLHLCHSQLPGCSRFTPSYTGSVGLTPRDLDYSGISRRTL